MHRAFGLGMATGVTSVLVGESSLDDAIQRTEVDGLDALVCGPIPPNPSELLHTDRFARLVADAEQRYDRVVFDTPPLGAVTDAAIIAPQVAGSILIVRSQATTRDAVRSALRQLGDVQAYLLGAIVNNVDLSARGGEGLYNYYYRAAGYYSTESAPNQNLSHPAA